VQRRHCDYKAPKHSAHLGSQGWHVLVELLPKAYLFIINK
jgi:hypothetical protein